MENWGEFGENEPHQTSPTIEIISVRTLGSREAHSNQL